MPEMRALQEDHPLMIAWKKHQESDDFANSKKWAAYPEHLQGSLWALFMAGWKAAPLEQTTPEVDEEELLDIATAAFSQVQPKEWDFTDDAVQAVIDAVRPHLCQGRDHQSKLEAAAQHLQADAQTVQALVTECVSLRGQIAALKGTGQAVSDDVAEARAILAEGDFLGVEESERLIQEATKEQPDEIPKGGYLAQIFDCFRDPENGADIKRLITVIRRIQEEAPAKLKRESRVDGWQPIETAPSNESVLIFIPRAEHYGPGVYRGLLVDMRTGPHWQVSGLHMGRDCPHDMQPTAWQPLPDTTDMDE